MNPSWNAPALSCWLAASLAIAVAAVVAALRARWPARHAACGVAAATLLAAASFALKDPLQSMATYSAGLMVLNQWVPPLLILAVPVRTLQRWRGAPAPAPAPGWRGWLLDPWVAATVFAIVSTGVSLPGIFEPALANALYSAPLGAIELLSGTLFWAQAFRALRTIGRDWLAGVLVLAGSMPMMTVAVVWMTAPHVLYMPYLNLICRWNITPLTDQHLAGFAMLAIGLPLQVAGAWCAVGGRSRHDAVTGT